MELGKHYMELGEHYMELVSIICMELPSPSSISLCKEQ